MRSVDAIVLLGPPGSGKSTLASELAARGIAHFEELEPLLLAEYGGREGVIAHKAAVLDFISTHYLRQLRENLLPVALQATGLSDGALLRNIGHLYRLLPARLNTPRDVCVARVQARPQDANLNNDPEYAANFHTYWHSTIAPAWQFDLALSGVDLEADIAAIRNKLGL